MTKTLELIYVIYTIYLLSVAPMLIRAEAEGQPADNELGEVVNVDSEEIQDGIPAPVCYPDLGCIALNSSWYTSQRPINTMPMRRDEIRTNFTIFTREHPNLGILIFANNTQGIKRANFLPTRPTKFFIHGFTASGYEAYSIAIREALLKYGNYNVIVVHWGEGARSDYVKAVANTRLVGLEVALLVNTLVEKLGAKAEDIHLIGHSLGAHTAGYAGEAIKGLGQITGLDPAGPFFRDAPNFIRLDSSDAKFVDVIHTDCDGYGIAEPSGHLDYYPNGGKNQPGCGSVPAKSSLLTTRSIMSGIADVAGCSHRRAIYLYIASMERRSGTCRLVGFECPDYYTFMKGGCTSCGLNNQTCPEFGIKAPKYPYRNRRNVKLYFNTDSFAPFCRIMYKVTINLANEDRAKGILTGDLDLSIAGTLGSFNHAPLSKSGLTLRHGQEQSFVFSHVVDVGQVKKVNMRWEQRQLSMDPDTLCTLFCNKKLYVSNLVVTTLNANRKDNKVCKVCPLSRTVAATIGSGSSNDFFICS